MVCDMYVLNTYDSLLYQFQILIFYLFIKGLIPNEMWSYPHWINQTKASDARQKMKENRIIYGGSESYRHMCRFNSGFFFRHQLIEQYDYYWRLEPGVEFMCDIDYDVFKFIKKNNITYGFTITLMEIEETIPTL